jgi:C-terminal processing protease CtpA/Prc
MDRGAGPGKMMGMVLSVPMSIGLSLLALSAGPGDRAPTTQPATATSQPVPDAQEIMRLVRQLGGRTWEQREEAARALVQLGPLIRPQLAEAFAASEPFEVRLRIKAVATEIFTNAYFNEPNGFLGIRQRARLQPAGGENALGAVIMVDSVIPGTAAARAGLRAGDLIVKFNGKAIRAGPDPNETMRAFGKSISGLGPGARVDITIVRGNTQGTVRAVLGTKPMNLYDSEVRDSAQRALEAWWRDGESISTATSQPAP